MRHVTVTISDELAAQAEARGVALETYVQTLIEQATPSKPRTHRRWTPQEIRAWLDELARFSDKIPPMPGETFGREMIYRDHD